MEEHVTWLTHPISNKTPLYGNSGEVSITQTRDLCTGDSCNASHINLPAHTGSHVDAPSHFIKDGKTLTDIKPHEWIFNNVALFDININQEEIISVEQLSQLPEYPNLELLLIRTGFERQRPTNAYCQHNPGFAPECAELLVSLYPSLRAIGFDFISLSSFQNRELGRLAHKEFLGRNILIFEDLKLAHLSAGISKVIALPLLIENGDGAPCSLLAWSGKDEN